MAELHSFYIFFRNKPVYRSLYTDAARQAVKNCTGPHAQAGRPCHSASDSSSLEGPAFAEAPPPGSSKHRGSKSRGSRSARRRSSPSDPRLRPSRSEDSAASSFEDAQPPGSEPEPIDEGQHKNYEKLLLGFLSGLASFSRTICETNELRGPEGLSVAHFSVCSTHQFKIHYFESVTGYKLVCITSCEFPNLGDTLRAVYVDLFNALVLSNPTYVVGAAIVSPEFDALLRKTILASI